MTKTKQFLLLVCTIVIGLSMIGCNESSSSPTTSGTTKTGLFKSEGTFSFSSNRGNFTAKGVFDTMMTSGSASGAFKYTEGKQTFIVVFAYNIVSQTNVQVVYSGVIDTLNATSTGSYSFAQTGTKMAIFGYFPNAADTSINSSLYFLTTGSMVVSTLSTTAISGTFSGTGMSVMDQTNTISITNGTYNSPIVEQYFAPSNSPELMIQQKIKDAIRKELQNK